MTKKIIKGFRVSDEEIQLIGALKRKIKAKTDSDVFHESLIILAEKHGLPVPV
jgi:hypothetical protein